MKKPTIDHLVLINTGHFTGWACIVIRQSLPGPCDLADVPHPLCTEAEGNSCATSGLHRQRGSCFVDRIWGSSTMRSLEVFAWSSTLGGVTKAVPCPSLPSPASCCTRHSNPLPTCWKNRITAVATSFSSRAAGKEGRRRKNRITAGETSFSSSAAGKEGPWLPITCPHVLGA